MALSKQDLGLGDCKAERLTSVLRHCHIAMLVYSLLRLCPAESVDTSILPTTVSSSTEWEWSLREAIYDLFPWGWENNDRAAEQITDEFGQLTIEHARLSIFHVMIFAEIIDMFIGVENLCYTN